MEQNEKLLREQLIQAIRGHQAHLDFESAVSGIKPELRGVRPPGAPHSAWELLEHMRIAQQDILKFSTDAEYKSPNWPEGYWPKSAAPPNTEAWDKTVAQFLADRNAFEKLVSNPDTNLFEPLAHGDGQTILREAMLIASHNSYHLGQLVYAVKQLSGNQD